MRNSLCTLYAALILLEAQCLGATVTNITIAPTPLTTNRPGANLQSQRQYLGVDTNSVLSTDGGAATNSVLTQPSLISNYANTNLIVLHGGNPVGFLAESTIAPGYNSGHVFGGVYGTNGSALLWPTVPPEPGWLVTYANLTNHLATVQNPSEYNLGNSGSSVTVDFASGPRQKVTLTSATVALTFTNPPYPSSNCRLKIIQDTTGSRLITTGGAVYWPNDTLPVPTSSTGAVDIINLYWDGTAWWATMAKNFKVK